MSGPPAAVAALRLAVRAAVEAAPPGALLLVACSGGPDSTALAAALAFEAPRAGRQGGLVTVDHHWSAGSAAACTDVLALAGRLGLAPAEVLDAPAPRSENAARDARRDALRDAVCRHGAWRVLLGHTLDDQAETVLLRLARGSGARSLSGMPAGDDLVLRPLLGLRRSTTHEACTALGLPVRDDPANTDPAFTRSRVRADLLPVLEQVLGPGAVPALTRSANLLRDDADLLDALAADEAKACGLGDEGVEGQGAGGREDGSQVGVQGALVELDAAVLAGRPPALRRRVVHRALLRGGCPGSALSAAHVAAVDDLVVAWRGQGPIDLPRLRAERRAGTIYLVPRPVESQP